MTGAEGWKEGRADEMKGEVENECVSLAQMKEK